VGQFPFSAGIVQVTNELVFLLGVDCQLALAYACNMKPSGELGLKDFSTPHALTLPWLLWVVWSALCGALLWICTSETLGQDRILDF
jgi:hypothetical protein